MTASPRGGATEHTTTDQEVTMNTQTENTEAEAAIDGSIPGRAALVMVDLNNVEDDPRILREEVREDAGCQDPHATAEGLWEVTKGDFPGWSHAIMVNERARFLMWLHRMRRYGDLTCGDDQATRARFLGVRV